MTIMPLRLNVPIKETSYNAVSHMLDTTDKYVSYNISIPKTGMLKKLGILIGSVAKAGTLTATIETILSVNGTPSGNLAYPNATGTCAVSTANTVYWIPFNDDTGIEVFAGDLVAIKIAVPYNVSIEVYYTDNWMQPTRTATAYYPYSTTTGVPAAVPPSLALEYSDELIVPNGCSMPEITKSATIFTPAVVGNRFKLPMTAVCTGAWIVANPYTDFVVTLYDSDGATVLTETRVMLPKVSGGTYYGTYDLDFTAPVTLQKDIYYRIVLRSTGTEYSNTYYHQFIDSPVFTAMSALPLRENCVYTSAASVVNEASWTQDNTKRYACGLKLSGIDIPTGTFALAATMNGGFT